MDTASNDWDAIKTIGNDYFKSRELLCAESKTSADVEQCYCIVLEIKELCLIKN